MRYLAKTSNGDALRAIAPQVGDMNVRTVRLERCESTVSEAIGTLQGRLLTNAVISVVDPRILDYNIRRAISVPAVCSYSESHNRIIVKSTNQYSRREN